MGKGDKRSRKGKIRLGSYGKSRMKVDNKKRYVPEDADAKKAADTAPKKAETKAETTEA